MRWYFLIFLAVTRATPLVHRWDDFEVRHAWADVPKGWEFRRYAPANQLLNLKIGMAASQRDQFIQALFEVSDPDHERYGMHLNADQINELVRPHADSLALVDSWLDHHGVNASYVNRSPSADWVTVTVSVLQAEDLLKTRYGIYDHPATGETVIRTLSYSLPSALSGHVDVISPTTYFSTVRSMRSTAFLQPQIKPINDLKAAEVPGIAMAAIPGDCQTKITPSCLRALYQTNKYKPNATSSNSLGVVGFLNEYANRADLQTFFKKFRPDAVGTSYKTELVNGGKDTQSKPGTEANLDIQYTEGMSFPTPNIYYSTGGSPPFIPDSQTPDNSNEPYLEWLNYILNSKNPIPQTFTVSYGDDEQTVPKEYATRVCDMFAQLGARGSSVLFSSGDFGVGGGDCKRNDGTGKVAFQPAFPAGCPFVTTVGGTEGISPEKAVSFSGGGFSNYFSQPSYQSHAVSSFFSQSNYSYYNGLFNRYGRAYPDVSAQGSGFQVVIGGFVQSVGGTSASSPTVAGIVALLNDYRISNGRPSLGFLNPLLYGAGLSGFTDITEGSNPGCDTDGFTASKGWDPVTGLGTPLFPILQKLV